VSGNGTIRVERTGLFDSIQDAGRNGYRRFGVPTGGWFDARYAMLANAMLGNSTDAACIEITQKSGLFLALQSVQIAIAGPGARLFIDQNEIKKEYNFTCIRLKLKPGDLFEIEMTGSGFRCYLAVKGGWYVKKSMGSQSSESRLIKGDCMNSYFNCHSIDSISGCQFLRHDPFEVDFPTDIFRMMPSLEFHELFDDRFFEAQWRLSPQSNRVGARFLPDKPFNDNLFSKIKPNRLSEPVLPGSIQWTGSELIILGPAGGTMGGYPRVGQLITNDFHRLAQACPGNAIKLRPVNLQASRELADINQQSIRNCISLIKNII
jgi:allophanate hydrolase subunit 2